jgi:hypothetical protein
MSLLLSAKISRSYKFGADPKDPHHVADPQFEAEPANAFYALNYSPASSTDNYQLRVKGVVIGRVEEIGQTMFADDAQTCEVMWNAIRMLAPTQMPATGARRRTSASNASLILPSAIKFGLNTSGL